MTKWWEIHDKKIAKGYTDVTELHREMGKTKKFKPNDDEAVEDLMENLQTYANGFIQNTYSTDCVTKAMVCRAQEIIAQMDAYALRGELEMFNRWLTKLYETIPRRMVVVPVASNSADMRRIVESEQGALNVMESKIDSSTVEVDESKTILEAFGLDVRKVDEKEEAQIKKHLGESAFRYKRAFRVVNTETEKAFRDFCEKNDYSDKDIKFYYHGSRNQNWIGILSKGLRIHNNAIKTGHMFGAKGLYFANRAKKSIGYSSLKDSYWNRETENTGYLAVFKVATKKPYDVYSYDVALADMDIGRIKKLGCDSLFAHKGDKFLYNDEIIVYDERQCTIRYIIEIA